MGVAGYPDVTFVYNENVYVYAGLTWAECNGLPRMYTMQAQQLLLEEKDRRGVRPWSI